MPAVCTVFPILSIASSFEMNACKNRREVENLHTCRRMAHSRSRLIVGLSRRAVGNTHTLSRVSPGKLHSTLGPQENDGRVLDNNSPDWV